MSRSTPPLPRWQQLWQIEWQRQREGGQPASDDALQLAGWRRQGDVEARLLARAQHHLGDAAPRLAGALRRLGALLYLLAALLAMAAAAGAWALLGTPTQPINVLWTWLALLAPSSLMLLLWLLALRGEAPAFAGDLLGRALARLPALWPDADAGLALHALLRGNGAWRWWIAALSHGLWVSALAGSLIGVLTALALRRYDFVWETTILPAQVFESVVHALGWLPSLVGFAQPDTAVVAASGEAPVAAARRLWASWLLGGVLVYGLLPRIAALLFCLWRARRALAGLRLPPGLPYYAILHSRLAPESVTLGVVDADAAPAAALQLSHRSSGRGVAWVGLELEDPPALPATALPSIDTTAAQQSVLQMLRNDPPAKLLVVVDAGHSPDRALLRQLVELGAECAAMAVWLHGTRRDRHDVWRDALIGIGLPAARVLDDPAAAAGWLTETESA